MSAVTRHFAVSLASAVLACAGVSSANAAIIDGSEITVTVSSINSTGNFPPQSTVNGAGLNGAGEHGSGGNSEWYTNIGAPRADSWISFDLGDLYVLDSAHVWNATQYKDFGIATLDIYVSSLASPGDPEGAGAADWTRVGSNVSFAQAGTPNVGFDLETQTGIVLPSQPIRHMRFESNSTFQGTGSGYVGLAEVQFDALVGTSIPEPASLVLVGLGALLTLPRRRRQA